MGFLFGLVLCFFVQTLSFDIFAQAAKANNASHKELIKKLNLKNFENLQGLFIQNKVLKEIGVELKTSGNFQLSRQTSTSPVLFHWNVEKPKASKVCLNSEAVFLTTGTGQKKISFSEIGADSGQQISSLMRLMSLDPEVLLKEFEVETAGKNLLLKPLKKESVFFESAQLHVNSNGLVDKIKLIEKSHDELQLQFSDLKTDQIKKMKPCTL